MPCGGWESNWPPSVCVAKRERMSCWSMFSPKAMLKLKSGISLVGYVGLLTEAHHYGHGARFGGCRHLGQRKDEAFSQSFPVLYAGSE